MKFHIMPCESPLQGRLTYSVEDYSFIFTSEILPPAITTLLVNTLSAFGR